MEADSWDSRTRLLLGDEAADMLGRSSVLVAGLGGVGGYVAEVLARSGIGKLILIDADVVSPSNLNRQIIATRESIGTPKTEVWKQRLLSINPDIRLHLYPEFLTPENIPTILETGEAEGVDFVADAIDTVAPKCALARECLERGIPLIASMGAGGRLDPSQIRYSTLADTRTDGLARVIRQRLRKAGVDVRRIPVVWSTEEPKRHSVIELDERNKRSSFGTLATIPAIFGIYMANYIIRSITGK